jgi:hypothetical protein
VLDLDFDTVRDLSPKLVRVVGFTTYVAIPAVPCTTDTSTTRMSTELFMRPLFLIIPYFILRLRSEKAHGLRRNETEPTLGQMEVRLLWLVVFFPEPKSRIHLLVIILVVWFDTDVSVPGIVSNAINEGFGLWTKVLVFYEDLDPVLS